MGTGIDKIQVWTPLPEVSVQDASTNVFGRFMNIKQGETEIPFLLTDKKGFQVYADRIYHNSKLAQYTINNRGLQIQFNPSKLRHQYHLSGTGKWFSATIKSIAKELRAIGIDTNLDAMKLARLDLAKQSQMRNPYYSYIDAFRLLKAKRAKNQREYPNGYLVGNTRWEVMSYDKKQELLEHNYQIKESNLMRLEARWLKPKAVSGLCHVDTLPVLASLAPEELDSIYVEHLNTKYFPKQFESTQMAFDFDSELEQMKFFINEFGKGWFYKYLSVRSIEQILVGFGGTENLRRALLEVVPKQTASDIVNQCKELLSIKAKMDVAVNKQTVSSQLYELQEKFTQ